MIFHSLADSPHDLVQLQLSQCCVAGRDDSRDVIDIPNEVGVVRHVQIQQTVVVDVPEVRSYNRPLRCPASDLLDLRAVYLIVLEMSIT